MALISVNGTCVAEEKAGVAVSDRGFRFGDGLFETIPVHAGVPYLWEYHLERLAGGLSTLKIPYDTDGLLAQAHALLGANRMERGLLRIQISRGPGSRGYLPVNPARPTVIIETLDVPAPPAQGVTLLLSSYEKISARALPTQFKLAQGLNSTLARMEAEENGCFDALLLAADGSIGEASSANIFWRAGSKLYTPSLATGALAGVTRRRVMELWQGPVEEGLFPLAALSAADAVIVTNAAMGAVAVEKLLHEQKSRASKPLADQINTLIHNDIKQYLARPR